MKAAILTQPSRRARRIQGDAYLKFQLAPGNSALLDMKQVQEVLLLPLQRLTPLPNMPPHILGLMNRRSRVIWVIDLPQMLNLPNLDSNRRQHSLVLLRVADITLGLAVQQIEGIVWLSPDRTQSAPTNVTPAMVAYLRGCVLEKQDLLLVLDGAAIAQSAIPDSL